MQSAVPPLALFALCIAVITASTLPHSGPSPRPEHREEESVGTATASSTTLEKQQTLTETFPGTVQLSQPVWTVTNASIDTGLRARLFLPRRKFANTCVTISPSNTNGHYNSTLSEILETLRSNKDMLASGQTSILQAIAGGSQSTTTCVLTGLENGQMMIITMINNLGTELDQLDDNILAAIATAKDMIIAGQGNINGNIEDLDGDLVAAKAMIIDGQGVINTNIVSVSTELGTAKDMIIAGQTTIISDIATLSTSLSIAKTMILEAIEGIDVVDIDAISVQINDAKTMLVDGQANINNNIAGISMIITDVQASINTINNKLDTLEQGQEKICDKIEALDEKLDTIIDKLMGTTGENCPSGAVLDDGKCFTVSSSRANFAEATEACVMAGGMLATMTADNEAVLYGLADSVASKKVWIGLTMESGDWAWQDGSPYGAFTDWPGAEPSAASMQCGEAEASSSTEGDWNDQSCNSNRFYICESDAT